MSGSEETPVETAGLTIDEAARQLGLHYMTVYRYLRTGRLAAGYRRGQWRIDPSDLDSLRGRRPVAEAGGRLADRLLAGDATGSWAIVEAARTARTPMEVYLGTVAPALREIGEGWAAGRYSVAEEHRATAVALGLLGRLGPTLAKRGRRRPGPVLLAGAEGDHHAGPVTMVGDILRSEGYEVIQLGADVPVADLVAVARTTADLRLVGVSVAVDTARRRARAAATALHRNVPGLPVIVGGPAVLSGADARTLGADDWAADAAGLVDLAARLAPG